MWSVFISEGERCSTTFLIQVVTISVPRPILHSLGIYCHYPHLDHPHGILTTLPLSLAPRWASQSLHHSCSQTQFSSHDCLRSKVQGKPINLDLAFEVLWHQIPIYTLIFFYFSIWALFFWIFFTLFPPVLLSHYDLQWSPHVEIPFSSSAPSRV